jgi:hypothetical protein
MVMSFQQSPPAGIAFPPAPANNANFYRKDLGNGWVYNTALGVWLGPEYLLMQYQEVVQFSASGLAARLYLQADKAIFISLWDVASFVATTNDGANNWGIGIHVGNMSGNPSAAGVVDFDTGSGPDQIDLFTARSIRPDDNEHPIFIANPLLDVGTPYLTIGLVKNGAPGNLDLMFSIYARDVRAAV